MSRNTDTRYGFRKLGRMKTIDNATSRLSVRDRLRRMPMSVATTELAYQTMKDRFAYELSRNRQLNTEREGCTDPERCRELARQITDSNNRQVRLRKLARDIGNMSFGLAFMEVAAGMLSNEAYTAISLETRAAMGRPIGEIIDTGSMDRPLEPTDAIVARMRRVLVEAGLIEEAPDAV